MPNAQVSRADGLQFQSWLHARQYPADCGTTIGAFPKQEYFWGLGLGAQMVALKFGLLNALLQGQAIFGSNLFGRPVPVSIAQLWIPRVELHMFYNTIVFIPMMIGMYYHLFPPPGEEAHGTGCNCAWTPKKKTA